MNKILKCVVLAAGAVFLSGCSTTVLPTGRYVSEKDSGTYAMVYKDLIFLTVKAPKEENAKFADWVWAGRYSVNKANELVLEMDSEQDEKWRFYYMFSVTRNGIQISDWSNNKTEVMRYAAPKRQERPSSEYEVRYEENLEE